MRGYGDCPIGVPLLLVEDALAILEGLRKAKVSLRAKEQPDDELAEGSYAGCRL